MNNLSIKDWAIEDRPREKMLLKGVAALSDAELLAILIGSGTQKETAVQLSQRILHSVDNNLNELGKLSIKETVRAFKGIGEAKAITIAAALELGRRRTVSERLRMGTVTCSKDAHAVFYPLLCDINHEEMWIALTNNAAKVTGKVKISQGGTTSVQVDIKLIMHAAIQALAHGIILCHNHPSGTINPSLQDDSLTLKVQEASKIMGIKLLDHIIIVGEKYYSYADEARIIE